MEMPSPANGEKDSDSGCCADMSNVEAGLGITEEAELHRLANVQGQGQFLHSLTSNISFNPCSDQNEYRQP